MRKQGTRYQILYAERGKPSENFTTAQKKAFDERVKQLRREKAVFSTWDTLNNPMSNLFRF